MLSRDLELWGLHHIFARFREVDNHLTWFSMLLVSDELSILGRKVRSPRGPKEANNFLRRKLQTRGARIKERSLYMELASSNIFLWSSGQALPRGFTTLFPQNAMNFSRILIQYYKEEVWWGTAARLIGISGDAVHQLTHEIPVTCYCDTRSAAGK